MTSPYLIPPYLIPLCLALLCLALLCLALLCLTPCVLARRHPPQHCWLLGLRGPGRGGSRVRGRRDRRGDRGDTDRGPGGQGDAGGGHRDGGTHQGAGQNGLTRLGVAALGHGHILLLSAVEHTATLNDYSQ
ncbi:hypothetical protein AQ490_09150 [Wenjunlia vitaminophila]|uniref:Uncharacterized protein n=1 Tax=Wenjunlia vitaminophila TaxID=76728 RepID=A0A0T6LLE1_WENVI|nr:hypothetical protein AQ490_09150 [Wenjunlia vitaminophila]